MLQIVCYKQYIQTVFLLNDFVCVVLGHDDFDSIFHILCTCIYLYEYSYGDIGQSGMQIFSHTEYMNTAQSVSANNSLYTNTTGSCHHVDEL